MIFRIFLILVFSLSQTLFSAEENLNAPEKESPFVFVIFGATGDLTARKLLPALYNLSKEGLLPQNMAIVGFARGSNTDETFRQKMYDAIKQYSPTQSIDEDFWSTFKNNIFYLQSEFANDSGYETLRELLANLDEEQGTSGNRLYYLATPSSSVPGIVEKLASHDLIYENGEAKWSRLMIEKPFGSDLDSAIELQDHLSKYLNENQIYRMDHYLAKEAVLNLFEFRFKNKFFEPYWNNQFIDNVQITFSEELGIGTRAAFWEETGALRDFFQNHLIQLLTTVAMDSPASFASEDIHREKLKVLEAIPLFKPEDLDRNIIRGQYGPGEIRGENVIGYREEKGVDGASNVETYVATKIMIENDRWRGVPFYIRGGKRLPKQVVEIAITLKTCKKDISNTLFIRIQPDPGIYFKAENSGSEQLKEILKQKLPDAYEKLIYDAVNGNQRLFVAAEEQIAAWRLLTPVLQAWKTFLPTEPFPNYPAGSWGPLSADLLLKENNHHWQLLENK